MSADKIPTPFIHEAPKDFVPTMNLCWMVGNYETDRILAQLWNHCDLPNECVWVAVKEFENPNR